MFKESLIVIVFMIIIYQIYLNYFDLNNITTNENKNKVEEKSEEDNNDISKAHQLPTGILTNSKKIQKSKKKFKSVEFQKEFVHPLYGKPSKLTDNGYLFDSNIPKPWTYIIFNNNSIPNHHYVVSLVPLLKSSDRTSILNVIGLWVNFLKTNQVDLMFNGQTFDLLIPSQDEEFALTICNLIINNIKGNLTINNIVDNNLIQISMQKIKKYTVIKNKIVEQILENLNDDSHLITLSEGFTNSAENNGILEYNEDLAMSDNNEDHKIQRENNLEIYENKENTTLNQPINEPVESINTDGILGYTNNFVSNEASKEGLSAFEQTSGTTAFSFI